MSQAQKSLWTTLEPKDVQPPTPWCCFSGLVTHISCSNKWMIEDLIRRIYYGKLFFLPFHFFRGLSPQRHSLTVTPFQLPLCCASPGNNRKPSLSPLPAKERRSREDKEPDFLSTSAYAKFPHTEPGLDKMEGSGHLTPSALCRLEHLALVPSRQKRAATPHGRIRTLALS